MVVLSGGRARGMIISVFPCQDDNTLIVPLKNKKEGTQTQAFFIRRTPYSEENRSKNAQGKICQHVEQTSAKGHGATLLVVCCCYRATLFELLKEAYECVTLFKMHGVAVRDFSSASTFSMKHQECIVKSNGVNKSDVSLRYKSLVSTV